MVDDPLASEPDIPMSQLRDIRARQLLVELDAEPRGLTWDELWPRLERVEPWHPEEIEKLSNGEPRGQNRTRWSANALDKAGWILTGTGRLRITRSGRQALATYPQPPDFYEACWDRYKAWDALRELEPPPRTSLADGLLPTQPGEGTTLAAALRLLDDGWRVGGSVFEPGLPVWSEQTVAALHVAFVQQADLSEKGFLEKLAGQLAGQSDDVVQLTAEMLALLLLPLADWRPDSKRQRVKSVLAMMADPVHLDPQVSAAMDHGVFNGSLAFKTLIWRQLASVIEAGSAWWRLNEADRATVWSDPWAWSAFLETQDSVTTQSARAELRYLLHPAAFPRIISADDRAQIRDAFADEIPALTENPERDLRDITVALQVKSGGPVDYYVSPFVERWKTTPNEPASRRAWLVRGSSIRGVDMIPTWLQEGFVSLSASQLPAMELPVDSPEVRAAVEHAYGHLAYAKREEKVRDIRSFLVVMEPGSLVLTTSGGQFHVGTLTGQPEQVDSEGGRSNLRWPVTWEATTWDFAELPPELTARLKGGSDVVDLTDVVDLVDALLPQSDQDEEEPVPLPRPSMVTLPSLTDAEADELLMNRAWLDELVDLLNEKRQVILYGPPGTGKTYLAQQVAGELCPPENVRLVQFHPAYSYEDFFEGYRPVSGEGGQVGFKLKAGPFRRIVEDAREHPDQPYVLVVDEINRANLAKVFGELYFLLEYRNQAVELLYADEDDQNKSFSLPKNVYLIGTMNTADRSIALVDSAMRRRFAFLSLHPDDEPVKGVLRAWLQREKLPEVAADLLEELNRRIPDKDFKIGPSYLMAPAVATQAGLERIWRTAILPLLEEFHYGDEVDVERRYGLRSLMAVVQPAEPDVTTVDAEGQAPDQAVGPAEGA